MASQKSLLHALRFTRFTSSVTSTWTRPNVAACVPSRFSQFQPIRMMSSVQKQFDEAKERLGTLKEDPGNETKLKMYALFKQSTSGKVTTKRPGMMDFVGRAKWDAWNGLGDMSQEEAQRAYIKIVEDLVAEEQAEANSAPDDNKYTCIKVEVKDGLRTITLNRPKKYNALTPQMYIEWQNDLNEAAKDPKTSVVAVTGAGNFFCAGNDLTNFANIPESGPEAFAKEMGELLYGYVDAFVNFPKPLVGVINGPAIGISVTTFGLYDAIYASDKAFFETPFTRLGQSAEGCSSYTFPRMMGPTKAAEMLIFNKRLTAVEAQAAGLVTEVLPSDTMQEVIWPRLQEYAKLPKMSLVYGKELYRASIMEDLKKTNRVECDRLVERWLSDECRDAIVAFMTRKK